MGESLDLPMTSWRCSLACILGKANTLHWKSATTYTTQKIEDLAGICKAARLAQQITQQNTRGCTFNDTENVAQKTEKTEASI